MVHNERYRCSVCQSVINLRMQIGYIEEVIFYICCPKCTTESEIKLITNNNDGSIQILLIKNAENVGKGDPFSYEYSIEASADLPSITDIHADPTKVSSPFMRAVSMYRNMKCHEKLINDLTTYQKTVLEVANYKSLFRLYINNKNEYLAQEIKSLFPGIDFQQDEARETFIDLFSEFIGSFTNYKARIIVSTNIRRILKSISNSNPDFDEILGSSIDAKLIDEQLRILMTIILKFLEKINEFFPLIVTRYFKEEPDIEYFETNYVATLKLDDLKELYVETYETIGKTMNIIIALHGLKSHPIKDVKIGGKSIIKILDGEFCSIGTKLGEIQKYGIENIVPNLSQMDSKLRNGFEHIDFQYDEVGKLVSVSESLQYSQFKIAYMVFKLYDTLVFIFEYSCLIKEEFIHT